MPALTEGALPSPDTVAGAFIRDLETRIAELEADGADRREAAELRDALRLGRLLLAGARGRRCEDPQAQLRDFRRYRDLDLDFAPG